MLIELLNFIKRIGFLKILTRIMLWVFPWFFLRYSFINGMTGDNDFVVNHATFEVYCQTMVTFYFLSYYIFPKYLYKKKFIPVLIVLFLILNVAHFINYFEVRYLLSFTNGINKVKPSYLQRLWTEYYIPNGLLGVFKSIDIWHITYVWSFFVVSIMLLFKVVKDVLGSQTRSLRLERDKLKLENDKLQLERGIIELERKGFELERDNLSLELNFLKSQINPHFLFNILNSIYLRTVDVSDEASDLVVKLADLMRYSLYNANEEQVRLIDEIDYIENYMNLEKYRHSNENVNILFNVSGDLSQCKIAPLLLISFVENAFKHGINENRSHSFVYVDTVLINNSLTFTVKNSLFEILSEKPKSALKHSGNGIGLANTVKRLNLLYASKHELKIDSTKQEYIVELKMELA